MLQRKKINRREFISQSAGVAAASLLTGVTSAQDGNGELFYLSIAEAAGGLRDRKLTSTSLVRALLARIDRENPTLNAFITVMRQSARAEAAALDLEAAQGRFRGPLHGIPLAIKDNIDSAGTRTTMGSLLFDDRVPTVDAFVVDRLRRAGAIVIGKANLHEFAMGGSSVTSYFGAVHNPWKLDREAGGSSGGSAAAVAGGLAFGALGTDTGGSVRIPAAWCGVVGLKPTYGLVSLEGIFPLIYSLDHCGPLTRTVEDAATMLTVIAGFDKRDNASVEHRPEDYNTAMKGVLVKGLRIGVPRVPFFDRLEAPIAAAVEAALVVLGGLVQSIKDVTLPAIGELDWTAIRAAEVGAAHDDLYRRHAGSYSIQTRGVVEGTMRELNDPGQTGADKQIALVRAQAQLARLRRTIDDAFTDFDLVVLPTNRIDPRTIAEEQKREERPEPLEPENIFNSLPFNLYGTPALSLPCGFSPAGLPIGLTIAGPHFSEASILALGKAYEAATSWHLRRPPLVGV